MFGAENHPPPVGHLRVQHVAEQAAALLLLVRPGVFHLQLQLLGQEGVAVNLAVGMGHGHAHHVPPVLEDEHVLNLRVGGQRLVPLHPQVHQLDDVRGGQLGQGDGVLGGVEDHLALAVAGGRLEEIGGHVVGRRRVGGQGGKIVVVFVDVVVLRHLARARAEGAVILGHLGPSLPVGGDHDPVVGQRMLAQLSHSI